jgi:hypothetical protein
MILKKVTSGHEIWIGEIKKLLFDFLGNGERQRHEFFRDNRPLDQGVRNRVEHVGRHFRSSSEVKKQMENFKLSFSR